MENINKFFINVWQLPQNIVGFIYSLGKQKENDFYLHKSKCGVTFGEFIFLNKYNETTLKHEQGHRIQSRILGPFYIFFIGFPSLIGNLLWRMGIIRHYYKQPWEKWADKLGGVVR